MYHMVRKYFEPGYNINSWKDWKKSHPHYFYACEMAVDNDSASPTPSIAV
jgi:hypothetical protein